MNFFNPQDYALGKWEINQAAKPEIESHDHDAQGFLRHDIFGGNIVRLALPADTYEIFSYGAPSFSMHWVLRPALQVPFPMGSR